MRNKNIWVLLAMLLVGIVLGSFLGSLASGISVLSWLNYGQSFGLNTPMVLDLGVIVITFGISIRISMASVFGIIAALLIYHCL